MELFQNEQQWPTLASSKIKQKEDSETIVAPNDWEILDDDLHAPETETSSPSQSGPTSGFVVVDDDSQDIVSVKHDHSSLSSRTNNKQLRHCVSSPMLSRRSGDAAVITEVSDGTQLTTTPVVTNEHEDLDDSFSMVSDVASVWTATSTTVKSTMTVSFRDAIVLSSPSTEATTASYRTVAALAIQKTAATPPPNMLRSSPHRQQRSRIQPKIVVVPSPPTPSKNIRRCSKSTGDLLGLTVSEEFDISNTSEMSSSSAHPALCTTDRLYEDEVYYRKAMGATSRMNSLKLRPDEAQRKEMILYKKDRQRQLATAMNGKNKATTTTIGKAS